MTSKEMLQEIEETRTYDDVKYLINKYFPAIEKDLEHYEELKSLMGTPIQDIMKLLKRLEKQDKILEILKPYIELSSDGIISCHNLILIPYYKDYEEQYNAIKEWLDGKN